jgi:hypothetical protein
MALVDSLASYWKLDEASGSASDATSGGKTLTNNGTTTYAASKINNGADFGTANTTKYLNRTGYVVSDGSSSFSFWVKQRTEIAVGSQTFLFSGSESTAMYLNYEYNAGTRRLGLYRIHNGVANATAFYTVTLGTSNFYHIVGTYNGSNIILYVNGTLVSTTADSGNGNTNWVPGGGYFTVGAIQDANDGTVSQYASAYIDEVGVWSKALIQAEVTSLYAAGVGIQYPFPNSYTMMADVSSFTMTVQSANLYKSTMLNISKSTSTMTNTSKST